MKTTTAEATCLPLRRDNEQAVPPGGSREETLASFLLCVTTLNRPRSRRGRKAEVDAGARGGREQDGVTTSERHRCQRPCQ